MASGLIASFLTRKRLIGSPAEYRLLTPICTALEVHSYKSAIQLCVKLQKKQPENYIVLALKALALSLASKPLLASSRAEIFQLVEFVKTHSNGAGLGDPDVLMFFGWVLDSMGRGDETLAMLAKATQRHAENEDVSVEAFLHYVRVGERKSAQQISTRMQKLFKSDKYLWWSIMTVVLQAREPNNPSAPLLLSLAERQITAHYSALIDAASTLHRSDTPDSAHTAGDPQKRKALPGPPTNTPPSSAEAKDTKGKGKAVALSSSASPTGTPPPSTISPARTPRPIEYDSAHEFYLVGRVLELSVQHNSTKPPTLVLPSLNTITASEGRELPMTIRECLLAHFASSEGDKWAERGLGTELWRREVELKHGSVQGGDWDRSWKRLKHALEGGDANWHTMLYLIRLSFSIAAATSAPFVSPPPSLGRPVPIVPLTESIPAQSSPAGASLIEEIRALFRSMAQDGEKGRRERGYLLALLEIERLERMSVWGGTKLGDLVLEYFERFSDKTCCFDDLKPYLIVLTTEEAGPVIEKLNETEGVEGELSHKLLQRSINASKVLRYIALSSAEEQQERDAKRFLQRYLDALPLGKGLPSTELQPADDYALLAAEAFVSAWEHSHNRQYLETSCTLLTYALSRSAHAFQLRLLLINLLRLLGCPSLFMAQYALLGVKAIQFDTLSHVVLSRGTTFAVAGEKGGERGVWEECASAGKWYKTGEHEASEMPVRGFSFHNYTKIEDFSEFQDRLKSSLSKHMVMLETLRLKLVRGGMDVDGAREAAETLEALLLLVQKEPSVLSDNRDFASLPNLQREAGTSIGEVTQMGPRTNANWLRAITLAYAGFFLPSSQDLPPVAETSSPELSPSEVSLVVFSQNCRAALTAPLEDTEAETATLAFFEQQDLRFGEALQDEKVLPWELLHIAEISLEGYCLLETAIDRRLVEINDTRPTDHAKLGKKLRTLRTAARELSRPLVARMNAYAKQVAKQRAPVKAGLIARLSAFEVFNEDYLTTSAFALVDSRRAMAEALASAMHRKLSGK